MSDLKQRLIDEINEQISLKEKEMKESEQELETLNARLKVEKKALEMKDVANDLKEDFKYSAQALESMLMMEQNKNSELKKEIVMLHFRDAVVDSQFSNNELK